MISISLASTYSKLENIPRHYHSQELLEIRGENYR